MANRGNGGALLVNKDNISTITINIQLLTVQDCAKERKEF